MKTLRFKIEGASPLLMHDDKTANPLNEYSKKLKPLNAKRKKTDEDYAKIAEIEWEASLYYSKDKGYYIKGDCFAASFLAAAKSKKLGTAFKQSVSIPDDPVLVFPHMKLTPDKLFEKTQYVDMRTVKVKMNKIMRCRPIFNEWSCEVTIFFDETRLDEAEIEQIVEYAAQYIGVCDYRPKFGRFTAERI